MNTPRKPTYDELVQRVVELERAETALESQNRLMTTLLDNLQVGVFMVEAPTGKPLLANRRARDLLGRGIMDDAEKSTLSEVYQAYKDGTDQLYPEGQLPIVRGLQGEKHSIEDMVVVHPDGRRVYLEVFGSPVRDRQGEVTASLVSFSDVTARKKAEDELRASQNRFRTVLDSIDATIYVADMETFEVLFMNRYMVESFGRDLSGEVCWKAFRNEPGQCPHCTNDKLIDSNGVPTGVHVWQGENPLTGKWYINYDRAIEWTDGRMVRIQIATDITAMRQLESQLRQSQKMESVGRLAGGVAHDFNNMLSIILGNTEMILEDMQRDEPFVAGLQEVKSAAERSADLVRQLLAFARKQTIAPRVLDLNKTTEAILKMLQRLIGEDIDLLWHPGTDLWNVRIDPSQVDQILANICVNARDAIAGVGRVTIETKNIRFDESDCRDRAGLFPGSYVMISMSDSGCGMGKEVVDNLFEPFFTTKELGKGSGLGLATVYGIVKQNGGFISVYSEPGHGTTFRVYLPRYGGSEKEGPRQDRGEAIVTGTETILLVEDEKAILKMTAMMLERLGYTVLAVPSPREAIRLGESRVGEIQLLMTDVVMPEMSGCDLAEKLIASSPDLKCLFMSGYTANVIAHQGVLDEGVQFIHKPYAKRDLAAKVREVLDES